MSFKIRDKEYYRTSEACNLAGISKNTFLRWVTRGTFPDVSYRDRRGWRLFTEKDVTRLKQEVNKIQYVNPEATAQPN